MSDCCDEENTHTEIIELKRGKPRKANGTLARLLSGGAGTRLRASNKNVSAADNDSYS